MTSREEKKRRKEIRDILRAGEREMYLATEKENSKRRASTAANMELKETTISNEEQWMSLLLFLEKLLTEGKIKIISGSLTQSTYVVEATFINLANNQKWELYCFPEPPSGGGYLRMKS